MKICILSLILLASFQNFVCAQIDVVLIEEDYEGASRTLNTGNNGASVTEVADPAVGGTNGIVAAVDLSGDNQWGAVNASPSQNLALPTASIAGTDTFFCTMDVYIDSANTTFNAGEDLDRVNLILRFNKGTDDASRVTISSNHAWESLTPDQWNTITIPVQAIPEVDVDGAPITHVLPIISLRDQNVADGGLDCLPGIAAYFDNFRIDVTIPADDPNLGASALNFGTLEPSTGPHTSALTVQNSGATNELVISAASITGTDAAMFTLVDAEFPMTIPKNSSAALAVSFAPGDAVGTFTADLVLTSNDQADETTTVALSGTIEAPFPGVEMILNGSFETGDLSDWRDNERFDYTTDQAHRGVGAAVFNLSGSQQWGESRVNQFTTPPATADDPQAIEITPEMIGQAYKYSAWYFRPSTGGMDNDDTISTIFRWNAKNPQNHTHGFNSVSNMPVDTWVRVTGEGIVPATDADGVAVDRVVPLWSFRDVVRDGTPGQIMYIDDVSFKIVGAAVQPAPDFKITEIEIDDGSVFVTFKSVLGTNYAIDRASVLNGVWLEEVETLAGGDGATTWEDTTAIGLGGPRYFYRVRSLVE